MGAPMRIMIAGAGIGGLTLALVLHEVGIEAEVFEQASAVRELVVGVNMQPHAIKELAGLGLLPALDRIGVRTRRMIYMTRRGQTVWDEPRGIEAGYDVPMFSIHRGKLQGVLYEAAVDRLGPNRIHAGHRLIGPWEVGDGVIGRFERRADGETVEVDGDALIGADGIHSALRAVFYPNEGPASWNGLMLWRGALDWPIYADGRTIVIAGGLTAKLVYYPIFADSGQPEQRLMNWVVMVRLGDGSRPPARREDWGRPGRLDTAHPMYPTGGNGASQAILDARSLARHLASGAPVPDALAAYEAERRPATTAIVLASRRGGPERVIDLVEARAPEGFDDLEAVAPYAEREAIVRGYASLAGYAQDQVNCR